MNKHEGTLIREDVDYLDDLLLDERSLYKAVPASLLLRLPHNHLQVWAHDHAIYQFVTIEMIGWLREQIGEAKALEICAGNGVIARTLGITGIDSRVQETAYFQRCLKEKYGPEAEYQQLTRPPKEIKKYEAMEAVRVFRPEIVIGAFVTPKGTREQSAKGIMGNAYGPNMQELLQRVKKCIHFGNRNTHLPNPIYDMPHHELEFPWLVNRSFDQSLNRVWVWES